MGADSKKGATQALNDAKDDDEVQEEEYYDDPGAGLLHKKSSRSRNSIAAANSSHKGPFDDDPFSAHWGDNPKEWQRPYWLGASLCCILFSFWILDSLKDPIFGDLVDGNLKRHQPIAKLVSVVTTLVLVVFLEFLSSVRKERQRRLETMQQISNESVLDEGGEWSRIGFQDDEDPPDAQNSNAESTTLVYILITYAIIFVGIAQVLPFHPKYSHPETFQNSSSDTIGEGLRPWFFVAYFIYAAIESFGSLAVASFWSFTNTTLSLEDAAKYYGPVIAIAQFGAVGGSTMVTTSYTDTTMITLSSLTILLHLVVMNLYTKRFRPSNIQAIVAADEDISEVVEPFAASGSKRRQSIQSLVSATASQHETSSLWSGVHLILRHNYVLLLLGVSCLYEVSLTCLDYQMKLIGYKRFESVGQKNGLTFTEFMGHYGQFVNVTSLVLSIFGFNFFIRRLGLRYTLRLFPTLLLIATVVAFGALPGNLYVLFISMSLLKAMTYSIHDPSKELLYLPTSNIIKFKAKFWIDIVGARVAKAIGSTINTYAGSVDRSVSVGSMPSLLTAMLLWAACYKIGIDFDDNVASGKIVGLENADTQSGHSFLAQEDEIHNGIYLDDGENQDENDDGEGVFLTNKTPEKTGSESAIELQDLKSNFKDPNKRRVSV